MFKLLKKQFYVQWENEMLMLLTVLGGFVFGKLLLHGILFFDREAVNYLPVGTMFGCIMAVMFSAITFVVEISIYFNIEISMGCTRLRFFVSFYTVYFVFNLLNLCLLLLLCAAENTMNRVLYPHLNNEVDFGFYLVRWGIPASSAVLMIGGFCGMLVMRFGRRAFWVLWAVWMFGCIGIPRIHSAVEEAPGSVLGRIGTGILKMKGRIPVNLWIGFAVLICLISFAGSYLITRKQQVTS